MVDPRFFAPADLVGSYQRGLQFRQQQQDRQEAQDNKRRLADLLPRAGRGEQDAIDQLYAVDPRIAMQMDEHQREIASKATDDLANAVKWADNPQKWADVQQFYAQRGVDISQYPFEGREKALVALGKLGEYLKADKMDIRATEPGGGLYGINPDGSVKVLVQPNDGSAPMGAPVRSGGVPQGAIDMLKSNPSLAPQFDQKYGPGASQRILGGGGSNVTGNFR